MRSKEKKKLTLPDLLFENKKFNETKEITVLNEYILNVTPVISMKNMNDIFSEFGLWIQDANVRTLVGDGSLIKYVMCFVVKYQTDLFTQFNYNHSNIELFNVFQIILNSFALDEIIFHIDKDSLQKLIMKFDEIIKVSEKIMEINETINQRKEKKSKNKKDKNINENEND